MDQDLFYVKMIVLLMVFVIMILENVNVIKGFLEIHVNLNFVKIIVIIMDNVTIILDYVNVLKDGQALTV